MQDDVWLAVSSDVVIFFDSLADQLKHFGRLRRVPLCAYLYFFASKGTGTTGNCKNYSTFESENSREIKRKVKNLHI